MAFAIDGYAGNEPPSYFQNTLQTQEMGHVRCLKGITITNPNDSSGTTTNNLVPYIRDAFTLKKLAAEMRGDVIIAPGNTGTTPAIQSNAKLSFYSQPINGSSIDPTTDVPKAYINTDGEASFSKLDIQGPFTVTGPLEVDGTTHFIEAVTWIKLTVDGKADFKDDVTMDGKLMAH